MRLWLESSQALRLDRWRKLALVGGQLCSIVWRFLRTHIDLPQAELGPDRHHCYFRLTPEGQPCEVQSLQQRCYLLP